MYFAKRVEELIRSSSADRFGAACGSSGEASVPKMQKVTLT